MTARIAKILTEADLRAAILADQAPAEAPYTPPEATLSAVRGDPGTPVSPEPSEGTTGPGGAAPQLATAPATWLSKGAHGAASELIACAYLMSQGFYVYRCESPHAPFDLVAYGGGRMLRVEVKTINDNKAHHAPSLSWPTNDEWDLLVAVGSDGRCIEVKTHDRVTCTNILRAAYGWPPVHPLFRGVNKR